MVNELVAMLSGLLVFVMTQTTLKLIIEPMQDQGKLRGEIAAALMFYDNVFRLRNAEGQVVEGLGPSEDELAVARKAIRDLASRMWASPWTGDEGDGLQAVKFTSP